ncbi:hypothetical protein FSP39_021345 [Pinctada imbricata]|uniref:Uncharacterized protein n=1 Tax=Pinctada imbricata TaxID=66713 RepID=A0AA88XU04_PINIB|nr:hypothetical protein FSP39_021345 [Pinctada imbricata]
MAARSELPVPAPMNMKGDLKGNWTFFKSQWENYEIATELSEKDEKIRVATLLTIMGKDCYHIFENLSLQDDDRKKIKPVLDALEAHFSPKTNVIYERYIFNTAEQLPNENFDTYLCRLRELSKSCQFGAIVDEMLRDKIVIGTKDSAVRARMLREPELTLDKAVNMCRTSERTTSQLQKLQSGHQTTPLP